MNYLEIARRALAADEKDERDEIGLEPPVPSSEDKMLAAGNAEALVWRTVYQGPVESTLPPPNWDGTLCPGCRWPTLCRVLGPRCPSLPGGPCPGQPG